MRIVLAGSGSLIAQAVAKVCRSLAIDHLALPHDHDIESVVRASDCLINFAIDPRHRSGVYNEDYDRDLYAARMAAQAGASFMMLSTRRVYPLESRWNATENTDAGGDETVYGRNKALSEKAVLAVCDGKAGVLRLSNIFGYEYTYPVSRRSFLGQLLYSLKQQNKIFFDMDPATRRDFLPIETCAEILVARAMDRTTGVYNLGSGFGIPCGDLAEWIMEGFGGGELISNPMTVKDEFFLNMDRWRSHFDLPIDHETMKDYCVGLGRKLK